MEQEEDAEFVPMDDREGDDAMGWLVGFIGILAVVAFVFMLVGGW